MKKEPIACVVVGASGRMGQRICSLITETEDFVLRGATESIRSSHVGGNLKDMFGPSCEDVVITDSLEAVREPFDVIIDFTLPHVSLETVSFASRTAKKAVVGTTGFSPEQMSMIQDYSSSCACVCAPNMSIGVNVLFRLVENAAKLLQEGFDAEVVELHHRLKKDAPSGTALKIATIVAEVYQRDSAQDVVYERRGFIGERTDTEIGVQTLRAGDVVGEHTVLFAGAGERIELIHRAQSRDCFAQGALRAARWIAHKPSGLYTMHDVLGLSGSQ